jgi:hypothetical protein
MTMLPVDAVDLDEVEELNLPWDHFVPDGDRRHVDAFRRSNWKTFRRELLQQFNWEIPDGLEPHWVRPGKVVYWQNVTIRQRIATGNGDSDPMEPDEFYRQGERMRIEDVIIGWQPTSALPAGNAQNIAHYLNKGFRFRPPREGIEAETLLEAAAAQDAVEQAVQTIEETRRTAFQCRNHDGLMGFGTWKAYLQHCDVYREVPDEKQTPEEVYELAKRFKFYCFAHNRGFNNLRSAQRHMRSEMRKPGKPVHASTKQMEVEIPPIDQMKE